MTRWIAPITLRGRHAVLEPLGLEHEAGLRDAVADGELWQLWYTTVPAPDKVRAYIETALDLRDRLGWMTFAVRDADSGKVVGSTRYLNVDETHHRLEIGATFYAQSVQRTALNTECKFLLLSYAFETLRAIAVEFRTHWMNHASRTAIARLGAKQDGVLRNHLRMPDGSLRDTVVFSIIESEWPAVKRHLQFKLECSAQAPR